jgi:glucosamine-6-phosphate deaminase
MLSNRAQHSEIAPSNFMLIFITNDYAELSSEAARMIANAMRKKPDLRLGLATGDTQQGMYRELVSMHREEHLDFSRIITFNLDEYVGIAADHPQSFHSAMRKSLFDHVNITASQIHIPDGSPRDNFDVVCREYEEEIKRAGGIDLQIVGIGKDGHIGFNEPTSSLASRTRPKTLMQQTIEDNRHNFPPGEEPPSAAITMGIGTILEARRVLLLASGPAKAKAVALAVEGPLTASVSASALQMHRDVTVLVDREASENLQHKDYYRNSLEMTRKLTPDRLW